MTPLCNSSASLLNAALVAVLTSLCIHAAVCVSNFLLSVLSTQPGALADIGAEACPISCHLTCREKHSKYKVEAILAGCKEELSSLEV